MSSADEADCALGLWGKIYFSNYEKRVWGPNFCADIFLFNFPQGKDPKAAIGACPLGTARLKPNLSIYLQIPLGGAEAGLGIRRCGIVSTILKKFSAGTVFPLT